MQHRCKTVLRLFKARPRYQRSGARDVLSRGGLRSRTVFGEGESEDQAAVLVSDELSDNHRVRGRILPDSCGCGSRPTPQQYSGHRNA
jgi:hypothetical protein